MKNKEDKNLEALVENMMKDISLETPSFDFTARVMSKAIVANKVKTNSYKPVISKGAWFIIFGCIATLAVLLIFNNYTQNGNSTNLDFNVFNPKKVLSIFSWPQFSYITINIIGVAMAMIFIQMILLKNHFNKKIDKTSHTSPQA